MFLAGGVDSPVTEGIIKGYTMIRALTQSWNDAPERASRPFSADRDGFVLAEGSWMFVLEDYDHAKARGAKIYAEITGYGATCEAYHRVRMSDSPEEPARAITLALDEANLAPEDIQYVSLHGTSTEMNDQVETRGVQLCGIWVKEFGDGVEEDSVSFPFLKRQNCSLVWGPRLSGRHGNSQDRGCESSFARLDRRGRLSLHDFCH